VYVPEPGYKDYSPRDPNKLSFPADMHTPNPATLSTCRASRKVVLERYKLCFGTHNVYVDLPGGNILSFAVENKLLDLARGAENNFGHGGCVLPPASQWSSLISLSDPIIADLQQVTYIALNTTMLSQKYGSGVFDNLWNLQHGGRRGAQLRRI
jgi:hypothetical protein